MNKKALHKVSYGLYIISSKKEKEFNGQIANSVFQVTAEPPTIAVSINKQNLTHEFMENSKVFTMSVLCEKTPMKFIGKFGYRTGRDINKFKDVKYRLGKTGVPIVLDYAVAFVESELIDQVSIFTHTIFVGKVIEAEILTQERCMTYACYHLVKGGKSPKNAPTYIKNEKIKKGGKNHG